MVVQDRFFEAVGSYRGGRAADRLCQACAEMLPVDAVAISLVLDGINAATLGGSGDSARAYADWEFTLGEGPSLDSQTGRRPVLVPDLADASELRWPAYTAVMVAQGVRAAYAIPVVVAGAYVGSLILFRREPGFLSGDQLAGAFAAAHVAGMPVLDLLAEDPTVISAAQIDARTELAGLSRAEVNQAAGMLVVQLQIQPLIAMARLRAHAWATERSVTDVARDIIDRRLHLKIG